MNANKLAIPVLMYHSVGRILNDWEWSFLTVPAEIFECHLKWLSKKGYKTVNLHELYAHVAGQYDLPPRSVVLTFDDGYLDNWTYVTPLLKKYGFKGTVFVNPDFVDPREIVRKSLDDVWAGRITKEELEIRGFMSWLELKQLAKEGPLSIQSHAMSHTWYPISSKINDFHHPGNNQYWLDWNAYPEKKPFYLINPSKTEISFGTPIYENDKSLAATRFFPNPEEIKLLVNYVRDERGEKFFLENRWREKLNLKIQQIRKNNEKERMESSKERYIRYYKELSESKQILESRLGSVVDFLCWPGGGYNAVSREIALGIYTAVTLGSADRSLISNKPGDYPRLIKRVGVPGMNNKGKMFYHGGRYLIRYLEEYQGDKVSRRLRQAIKICDIFKAKTSSMFLQKVISDK